MAKRAKRRMVMLPVPDPLPAQDDLTVPQLKALNRKLQHALNDAEGRHVGECGRSEALGKKLEDTQKELTHVKTLLSGEILDLRQKLNQVVKIFEATCAVVKTY